MNQRLTLLKRTTSSNLTDLGWAAVRIDDGDDQAVVENLGSG